MVQVKVKVKPIVQKWRCAVALRLLAAADVLSPFALICLSSLVIFLYPIRRDWL